MKPDRHSGKTGTAHPLRTALFAILALLGAGSAQAQSAYACRALERHAALPAVEGKDGTFFAIRPELQAHHGMGDETIAHLAALKDALASRGTTLVLLPVPTRAQVMVHKLPPMAAHLGFHPDLSVAVHTDMLTRLNQAGLTVADPLSALRRAALGADQPYFATDPRPTTYGTRILAASVGKVLADHPDLNDATRGSYTSTKGAEVTLPSAMRAQLQTACETPLPPVTTASFGTARQSVATGSTGTAFGAAPGNRLVVLGTEITGTPELNLAGFLSEATGLEVLHYGVPRGGAYAAISSYLTSADFRASPPRVLVWELPVSAPMGDQGAQPMKELITAAGSTCTSEIALTRTPSGDRLRADLSQMALTPGITLSLGTGGVGLSFVRFHFTGADGLVRSRSIYRHRDQILTGQFYLPLSGLNTTGVLGVEIEGHAAFGPQPRLLACS